MLGSSTPSTPRSVSGVKAGEKVIIHGQNGPARRRQAVTAETPATPNERRGSSRSAIRAPRRSSPSRSSSPASIAAFALPSSIYPPLEFPRIVIIAHSGTLPPQSMMLTVTRPLEQAVMEVPGIRRVRSRSIRGAAEISAQFDPSTDMVVALQQVQNRVAETRGELPADTELTVERLTPAVFPIFILSMTGPLPTPDLNDYAHLRRAAGTGPRAGRRPDRSAGQRHARDRGGARSARS